MRQVVYDALAALPDPHTGRVWPVGNLRTSFQNAVEAAKLDSLLTSMTYGITSLAGTSCAEAQSPRFSKSWGTRP
jgi:hypothetical protein